MTAELHAAKAEAERLTDSEAEAERDRDAIDAERDVLEMLADIRKSMAGEIQTAVGAEAVRAALSRLFSGFSLHPRRNPRYEGRGRSELVDAGDELMIELQVRERALVGYSHTGMYPVLRREPLHENNQRDGLPIRSLFLRRFWARRAVQPRFDGTPGSSARPPASWGLGYARPPTRSTILARSPTA
jgi:hypothetical protein